MNRKRACHIWVLVWVVELTVSQSPSTTITQAPQPSRTSSSGSNSSTITPSLSNIITSVKASPATDKPVTTNQVDVTQENDNNTDTNKTNVTSTPVSGNGTVGYNSETSTSTVKAPNTASTDNSTISQPTSAPKPASSTAYQSHSTSGSNDTTLAPSPTLVSVTKNESSATGPVTSRPTINSSNSTFQGTSAPPSEPSTVASTTKPEITTKSTNKTNTVTPATPVTLTNKTVATPAPINASATTRKPSGQSTSPSDTTITTSLRTVSPTNESNTSSTSKTDKQTSAIVTTIGPPSNEKVYISEILMDKQGSFQQVEIQFSNNFDAGQYTMVVISGDNNESTFINLTNFDSRNDTSQILTISMNAKNLPTMSNSGIGIAIYNTKGMSPRKMGPDDWTLSTTGLVDALVIGTSYETTSKHLIQILTPGMYPFVLDPSLYGQTKSISRCSSSLVRSSDMYALIYPSIGSRNDDRCQGRYLFHNTLSLRIHGNCGLLENSDGSPDEQEIKQLVLFVVKEVNKNCQCGLTKMHVIGPKESDVHCCGDLSLDMQFVAPNKAQDDAFLESYKTFIQSTNNLTIGGREYTLDKSCYSHCCVSPQPVKDDSGKKIQVTVAVIVTCLVVFLIILVVLFMYMRRKKIAVYQFRMSRLTEEEDDIVMDHADCDEFIGGQEATFDIKR